MEFGGALKGRSRGNGSDSEKGKIGVGSYTGYSMPSGPAPLHGFVEFHAV